MANSRSAFGNFLGFFPLNIFNPQLIKSADAKALGAKPNDMGSCTMVCYEERAHVTSPSSRGHPVALSPAPWSFGESHSGPQFSS